LLLLMPSLPVVYTGNEAVVLRSLTFVAAVPTPDTNSAVKILVVIRYWTILNERANFFCEPIYREELNYWSWQPSWLVITSMCRTAHRLPQLSV